VPLGPPTGLPARQEATGRRWKPIGCQQMCLEVRCCLLEKDGARHQDPWQLVALPEVLQGMSCSRCPTELQGPRQVARLELADFNGFPEVDEVSPHQFPVAGRLSV